MKKLFTILLFCTIITSSYAQKDFENPFIKTDINFGLKESQLTYMSYGADVGFGFIHDKNFYYNLVLGYSANNNLEDKWDRTSKFSNFSIGFEAKPLLYKTFINYTMMMLFADFGFSYNFANITSQRKGQDSFTEKHNFAVFSFGGSFVIPLSPLYMVKNKMLKKSKFLIELDGLAIFDDNISLFKETYSNISSITWGQQISLSWIYELN